MSKTYKLIYLFLLIVLASSFTYGQWNKEGLSTGIMFGATLGKTESSDQVRFMGRVSGREYLTSFLQAELGLGLGRVGGDNYNTLILPIDVRLLFYPVQFETWRPYLYGGYGEMFYNVDEQPVSTPPQIKTSYWTGYYPVGVGFQFKLDDQKSFEIHGGYNQTVTADLNAIRSGTNKDAFWNVLAGFVITPEDPNKDSDNDGIPDKIEKQLGTDPHNPDTDGDGLTDGDEVNVYKTNPLKADSDGDGLNDGDEVKVYKTNPNVADTDGDGLSDGDEVNKYHTDPLKKDTDGDGLNDNEEIQKYHTDPLKADTDNDGLNDGDEVNKYKTDPLKADTDGGTVNDGTEVARGTNPLDPSDDIPKVEPKGDISKVEKGQSMVLEGIVFETNKATITAASDSILAKVVETLNANPDITVEIQGHTDNKGSDALNTKLSQKRADAVKAYLVKKGIEKKRLTSKGYGSEKPVASNDTDEGRQKNRRIEFLRTN
jgi:outer membrane protein OmpA-like peptidoglycan-associated protein